MSMEMPATASPEGEPKRKFDDLEPVGKMRAVLAVAKGPMPQAEAWYLSGIDQAGISPSVQGEIADIFTGDDTISSDTPDGVGYLFTTKAKQEALEGIDAVSVEMQVSLRILARIRGVIPGLG